MSRDVTLSQFSLLDSTKILAFDLPRASETQPAIHYSIESQKVSSRIFLQSAAAQVVLLCPLPVVSSLNTGI